MTLGSITASPWSNSDEAIQDLFCGLLDCFASLAMTIRLHFNIP